MNLSYAAKPFESEGPTHSEIAALAWKFYEDSDYVEGLDRENWLFAEYMLTQRDLIRCQLEALRNRAARDKDRPVNPAKGPKPTMVRRRRAALVETMEIAV